MTHSVQSPAAIAAALQSVERTSEPAKLKQIMINAKARGIGEVYDAAFRKLVSVMPTAAPGTLDYELWRSIHALESALSEERGKTTRLARTRQKIARVGVRQILIDFANHPTSTAGFDMLIERQMPELTGEAIVLRHRDEFPTTVVEAAKIRLERVGVDTTKLSRPGESA